MKKARILVIDDEPSVVDALKLILSDNGYEALVAVTAREAIQLARRHEFDVAIVDLRLPDISGLDLLARITENCPGVDGILMTAYESAEVRAEAATCGFAAVLPKPFSPRSLLDSLSAILSQRARLRTRER
jgi:DNA-binding NtrC family response regulator